LCLATLSEGALWRTPAFWSRILIVFLYCMSWLYVGSSRSRQESTHTSVKWLLCGIDLVTMTTFRIAFAFAGDPANRMVTSVAILGVAILYFVAQVAKDSRHGGGVTCAILAVLVLGADVASQGHERSALPWCDVVALAIVALLYVLFLTTHPPPPPPANREPTVAPAATA
jgi:hypothetical protein